MNYLCPESYTSDPDPSKAMNLVQMSHSGDQFVWNDGDKYPGGFGATKFFINDLWTLRARSRQLFTENLYACGLIKRLITNEINTGLTLEATPIDALIPDLSEEDGTEWSENVELRFGIYSKSADLCHHARRWDFGKLQRIIRMSALVDGDVLLVMRIDQQTGLPTLQIVSASLVQTPLGEQAQENRIIKHGVEVDKDGRHIAFWITQEDGSSKRVAAFGPKSGRRLAWMVYGTDKLHDDTRGEPLLGVVLQSLKEIDRYRDAAQRKAALNAVLAMFIKRNDDKPASRPMTGGAVLRNQVEVSGGSEESPRKLNFDGYLPGMIMDELQVGEEPVPHSTAGTDVNFVPFETAILSGVAWGNEIPPEILILKFTNSFSASRAALNEFQIYLNKVRSDFSANVNQYVYIEWLMSEVLQGNIQAPGIIAAWRNRADGYIIFGAWTDSDWLGAIKPSVDLNKEVLAQRGLIREGWSTNDRAARALTGTKWSKNIKRLAKENVLKAEALRPLLELQAEFGENEVNKALGEGQASADGEMVLSEGDVVEDEDTGKYLEYRDGELIAYEP